MSTTEAILLAVVAVAIVLALVWVTSRLLRRRELRHRFGDEYEVVLDQHGSKRQADRELTARQARHDQLDLPGRLRPTSTASNDPRGRCPFRDALTRSRSILQQQRHLQGRFRGWSSGMGSAPWDLGGEDPMGCACPALSDERTMRLFAPPG